MADDDTKPCPAGCANGQTTAEDYTGAGLTWGNCPTCHGTGRVPK